MTAAGSPAAVAAAAGRGTARAGIGAVRPAGGPGAELAAQFPARPVIWSWPQTRASRPEVLARLLAAPFALGNALSQQTRRQGLLTVVSWLESQPGDTWQERWAASGAEAAPDWRDLAACWRSGRAGGTGRPAHIGPGLLVLICADVIRPGLAWLSGFAPARRGLAEEMARTRDSAAFAELAGMCQRNAVGAQTGQTALIRIALIMAAKGGTVADITVGDCLELLDVADQVAARLHGGAHSPLFYQLLLDRGGFPGDAPAAMRVFSGRGQPTCEQLIDRYGIACQPVRDVLVDYLAERKLASDFSSLQRLAYLLGKLFWADLEARHPGIATLKLPRDIAAAWKQRVMTKARTTRAADGTAVTAVSARLDGRNALTAVRSMYLDIAEWADDDPRWVPWAVHCPVSASEVSHKKDRSRRKSRMDQRTRDRLPVLPALAAWVDTERKATAGRLQAAQDTAAGALFTTGGQTLRRPAMKTQTTGRTWAEDPGTGKRRDLTFEEHRGFWVWAAVEVLRFTGIFSRGANLDIRGVFLVSPGQRLINFVQLRHRCGARMAAGMSPAACRGVELGHEFAVGSPGGGEFLVAFFQLEPQVGDLLLEVGDVVAEGVDVGGRAEPGVAPGLLAEHLGQAVFELLDTGIEPDRPLVGGEQVSLQRCPGHGRAGPSPAAGGVASSAWILPSRSRCR